jgi:K+-transporting ATPase ATPase C chain
MMAPAIKIFIMFTLICGVLYTGVITGAAQLLFPYQANGSIIEINGKRYGSEVIGQPYADNGHLWGRIMNPDVSSYTDTDGNPLLYAEPSNISPASEEFKNRVHERVEKLRAADPEQGNSPIPADLVAAWTRRFPRQRLNIRWTALPGPGVSLRKRSAISSKNVRQDDSWGCSVNRSSMF